MAKFGRVYELTVGRIKTDALDIEFNITKSLKRSANAADISIYNLNPSHRAALKETKQDLVTQLIAGYEDEKGVIFLGGTREVVTVYDAPNYITTVSSAEGEKSMQTDRINKSFAAGTNLSTVIKELGGALQVDQGNLDKILSQGVLPNGATQFVKGFTVSGNTANEFERVLRSAGFEWSVQNGKLQILKIGEPVRETAILLNISTGLLGSPTIDKKGNIEFEALLSSKLVPGKQVKIESKLLNTYARIAKSDFTGGTRTDWKVSCEAKEIRQ